MAPHQRYKYPNTKPSGYKRDAAGTWKAEQVLYEINASQILPCQARFKFWVGKRGPRPPKAKIRSAS